MHHEDVCPDRNYFKKYAKGNVKKKLNAKNFLR